MQGAFVGGDGLITATLARQDVSEGTMSIDQAIVDR